MHHNRQLERDPKNVFICLYIVNVVCDFFLLDILRMTDFNDLLSETPRRGKRSQEMQRDHEEGKRQRYFMSWPTLYL